MLHYDVEILDRPDNGWFLNTHSGKSLRQTIRYLFQSALDKDLQGVQARVRLVEDPPPQMRATTQADVNHAIAWAEGKAPSQPAAKFGTDAP